MRGEKPEGQLRRGWTTGACATAAVKAAFAALRTGEFPDPVSITLPKGETPAFPLALEEKGEGWAQSFPATLDGVSDVRFDAWIEGTGLRTDARLDAFQGVPDGLKGVL